MTSFSNVTPILRIFDENKAREFYLEFLGFKIEFEHRFEDGLPLYMGVSHSGCELHLSEHHGDASPGAHVRIEVDDIDAFCQELAAKKYRFANPGTGKKTPWGSHEATITDPFGNKLTFVQTP